MTQDDLESVFPIKKFFNAELVLVDKIEYYGLLELIAAICLSYDGEIKINDCEKHAAKVIDGKPNFKFEMAEDQFNRRSYLKCELL